jgi:AraC-like DNA-binding protein
MIGKSRQPEDVRAARTANALDVIGQGCGVLRHSPPPGTYQHVRHPPPEDLATWVEHFWIERWSFADAAPQTRELLPHPAVHLVFAPGRSRIYGVQQARFVRELRGTCCILGVKFHPGAFFPFFGQPISVLADTSIAAADVFARASEAETEVLEARGDRAMVQAAAAFVRENIPAYDIKVERARHAVDEIVRDPTLARVGDLVQRLRTTERALQRLFFCYVGASPRWVIKRYRTFEALERLAETRGMDLSDLAQDLGYFDQAHFTNDFKRLTGHPPAQYAETRTRRATARNSGSSERR